MKVYVHYEGTPEFTLVVRNVNKDTTVQAIKEQFLEAYKKKHSTQPSNALILVDERKRRLPDNALVLKVVSDREDLFVIIDQSVSSSPPVPSPSVDTKHEILSNRMLSHLLTTKIILKQLKS
eukprot:TRINITY_DN2874_c1_g2_i1.p1 TRINITY_DN2874_c1_g2~~TRINITY_DN2874_c1_g2_i1.p1  ORF type:complete len:122 (-),score=14.98 TRINITY_DN2874_c1_g2_i1:319-684(-)